MKPVAFCSDKGEPPTTRPPEASYAILRVIKRVFFFARTSIFWPYRLASRGGTLETTAVNFILTISALGTKRRALTKHVFWGFRSSVHEL